MFPGGGLQARTRSHEELFHKHGSRRVSTGVHHHQARPGLAILRAGTLLRIGIWQVMRVTAPQTMTRAVGVIPCVLLWSRVFLSRPRRSVCRAVCRHFAVVRIRRAGKPTVSDSSAEGKVCRLTMLDALDRTGEEPGRGFSNERPTGES